MTAYMQTKYGWKFPKSAKQVTIRSRETLKSRQNVENLNHSSWWKIQLYLTFII